LELLELGEHRDPLLGREQLQLTIVAQATEVVEAVDPIGDRAPVGEQAAEPAMVDVRHADALRLLLHGVLRLLFRTDEQYGASSGREAPDELVGLLDQLSGLLEVDDVDPAALGEDEPAHLRVPAAGLV